jgi:hypothetical protein
MDNEMANAMTLAFSNGRVVILEVRSVAHLTHCKYSCNSFHDPKTILAEVNSASVMSNYQKGY